MIKNQSGPTPEEISSSKYCSQAIESLKTFQQSNSFSNGNDLYENFIKDFNTFVLNENNPNLIKYYSTSMLDQAMKFSSKSDFNKENVILLFSILTKIVTLTTNISTSDFSNFIFSLMSNIESIEILNLYQKTLESIFSSENFFSEFVEQQRVTQFFEISFINFKSVKLCSLFRHLVCEISPQTLLSNINLSKIITFLLTPIRDEIQIEYSIVLSKLISNNRRNRLFLNNSQSFDLFSNFIKTAESDIIIDCFNRLVFTSPIDLGILSNIILFYQKYPKHQNPLFHWIFDDVVQNHTDMLYEINEVIPLSNWIAYSTTVSDVIKAISILSKIDITFTSPFISPLFSLLNKGDSNFECYQSSIQIIENQILLHQLSLNSLANSLFLETFVINIKIDLLGQLFEKIYTFSQLVYDIYTLPQSRSLRATIINRLIQMAGKFPKTAQFISIFLVVSNSKKNISDLMNTIIENKNGDLCVALGDSFIKSERVVEYFINGNGMEWLDSVYNMKIINIKQLIFLINSLTKNYFIKEVDNYINSLPKNHPLFQLKQEDLFTLCYGFEGAQFYYPLKILSLFPLLNTFQKVDPYNAYMIGKHAIDKFDNMQDLPMFYDVVNRYVTDESFQKIIKMDASLFDSFCNPFYDHFPLFQIYEFLDENSFDVKFKGISFWFKFGPTIRNELKIPFFHADKLQLFLKNSKLIANYEGVEYDAQVNPTKWNNVIVVVSAQKVSHYVEVYVNLNKAVFISSRLFNEMPNFEFSTYSAFLFIGPAIRLYQNEMINDDIEKIYKNGPSFLGHLKENLVITPSSKEFLEKGKNVFAVKYRGFPVHFLSKKKLNILFDRMINSQEEEFYLLATTCFKIFSMLRNSLRDFFRSILTVYSKVPKFISLKLLQNTLDFFFKYYQKSEIIDIIIGHKKFWSNVPKDTIIIALLSKLRNLDFYKEKEKLETFLAIETFYNFNNHKLFEYLFHCSNTCHSIIHELFTSSHFISEKQDKFTQVFLEIDKNNNENSVQIIDENNVSVQCNIKDSFKSFPSNFDLISTFQKINPIPFQKSFADMLNKLILSEQNINYVPFDGIYSLFLTSDTEMKAILFPVLLNCEKINPNSIQFDTAFLSNVPQLFNYDVVWIESFNLLTLYSKEIMKPSILPVIFALFWGATVASLHSVLSTGKIILNDNKEINKIISFLSLENNMKVISNEKNTLKFIVSWFPFVFGDFSSQKNINNFSDEGYESQSFKLNGNHVSSPSPFCFISMIWREVIKSSGLPIQTKKENYNELQSFLVCSHIFDFFFKFLFSLSDSNFTEVLGSFLSAPFVSSNKELAKCYACDFVHSLLNIVAESYILTMKIDLIFPFIHNMCFYDIITKQYLSTILSDLFLIASVIFVAYKSSFSQLAPHLSYLILNLFLSSLKICKNSNDDNYQMINVLYQVLFQQIHFLSTIAQDSQKEIDLYLLFFNQSYQFCTKKEIFNKVLSSFKSALNLSENSDFSEENNEFDLTKWDDFVKNNIIPLINQNEIYHLSLINIKDYSKSFTISYWNALEKQIQISETLTDLFTIAKSFRDSKVDWNKTLNDIYQDVNDSFYTDKRLSISAFDEKHWKIERKQILRPFVFPLRIPRLFVILPEISNDYHDDEFINKFIDEMNLYKNPLENLDILIQKIKTNSDNNHDFDEKTDIFQCEIKRLNLSIHSILIVLHKEILILPFCRFNHSNLKSMNDLNPPLKSSDVSQFVKEVIDGNWGSTILYMGRILIRISLDSILLTEQIEKDSIAIWSISSGHFLIEKYSGDVDKFVSNLKKRKNFPFSSSIRVPTLEKFIIAWKNCRLSNSQLLLGINLFNRRTFSDEQNFPLFPSKTTVYGSLNPISEKTLKYLKEPSLKTEFEFSNTLENSQDTVTQFITDKFMLNININNRKSSPPLFEGTKQFLNQKLNTENLNEGKIFDFNYNTDSNKLILNLPKMSARISDENELIFLIIDKGKLSLSIIDFARNETICEEKSSLLASAKNLYVSENRFFFSIDFNTNITCIYQIVYSNLAPKSFKFIRDISFEMMQKTSISGVDWLAATCVNDRLIMWHFSPNTIHRIVQFNSKIEYVCFDENGGIVWVVSTVKNETDKIVDVNFTLLSVNGEIFAEKSLHLDNNQKIEISTFSVVPHAISVNIREAVCGFSDGSVYFLTIFESSSEIILIKLNSLHQLPLKKFILHPCTSFFVSVDSGNNAFLWTQKNDNSENCHFLDVSAFDSCPACGSDELTVYCKSCGRVFCKNCLESCEMCKDCLRK